jgi:hypothetical protein
MQSSEYNGPEEFVEKRKMYHGDKIVDIYRRKLICKCGNDTFYSYEEDAACVCTNDDNYLVCTKCEEVID